MAKIESNTGTMTLINTFHVEPGAADRLIAALVEATETVMRQRPGYISANIHKSEDGTRVINYAQWASKADFDAMRSDPTAQTHMRECAAMAKSFDPVICEVVWAE